MSRHPDLLIIGGGIFGCSIAWHYTQLTAGRVLLLERGALASATTSRAAALLTQVRAKTALMPLIKQTYADINTLETELGEALALHRVGSLHVAASTTRLRELRELATLAESSGLRADWLTMDEAIR